MPYITSSHIPAASSCRCTMISSNTIWTAGTRRTMIRLKLTALFLLQKKQNPNLWAAIAMLQASPALRSRSPIICSCSPDPSSSSPDTSSGSPFKHSPAACSSTESSNSLEDEHLHGVDWNFFATKEIELKTNAILIPHQNLNF